MMDDSLCPITMFGPIIKHTIVVELEWETFSLMHFNGVVRQYLKGQQYREAFSQSCRFLVFFIYDQVLTTFFFWG